jgi:hypothetical protein
VAGKKQSKKMWREKEQSNKYGGKKQSKKCGGKKNNRASVKVFSQLSRLVVFFVIVVLIPIVIFSYSQHS